jgi:hypothetical protein
MGLAAVPPPLSQGADFLKNRLCVQPDRTLCFRLHRRRFEVKARVEVVEQRARDCKRAGQLIGRHPA